MLHAINHCEEDTLGKQEATSVVNESAFPNCACKRNNFVREGNGNSLEIRCRQIHSFKQLDR
ncbi:hypothetical protein PR048_021133 [Dryococelus australis]|uniref:Uncharacterized protein n=1 Tax=Dryococelus australis TaxID=614101 RepID=A0ABQ9GXE4_9NEOP|nr:hypothetical protein PR048_021133 [Dryococelus australis]